MAILLRPKPDISAFPGRQFKADPRGVVVALCSASGERSPTEQPSARPCCQPGSGRLEKGIRGRRGSLRPSQRGLPIHTLPPPWGLMQSQVTFLPPGCLSPEKRGPRTSADIHLHQTDGAPLGDCSSPARKAPCQRSPVGMASYRQGLSGNRPRPKMLSRPLLRREWLLAGLRPPVREVFREAFPSTSASGWCKGRAGRERVKEIHP